MVKVSKGILVGCGNPLLDISAKVDSALLLKYEMKPNDAILAEENHMPLYAELIKNYNAEFIAGGSVQNTLRVCQWLLQQPDATVFFGCVGSDHYAKKLEERAHADGVNVQYQYIDADIASTGTCAVLITDTHRSLCANLSAANQFTLDHLLKPQNQDFLAKAKYFYISGFFFSVSVPSIMHVAEHVLKHNLQLVINLSAPFICEYLIKPLESALPYVDVVFGNEAEATALAKSLNWQTTDLREIGQRLRKLPKLNNKRDRIVLLTQGQHPVLLFKPDGIEEFPVDALTPDQIVDTNGAGDAFVGGFLSQYIQEKPLDVCVKCGIWTARQIIQRSGCTFEGVPDFTQ